MDPDSGAASACGMNAAREKMVDWQNMFDPQIYAAALQVQVPARLIKAILLTESQGWPFWGTGSAGEVGAFQVTDAAADVLLRYDPALLPEYPRLGEAEQADARAALLAGLDCPYCTLSEAIQKTRENIPTYARLLAAYRCRAVSLDPALAGTDAWRQAAADYNGGIDYIRKVEQ